MKIVKKAYVSYTLTLDRADARELMWYAQLGALRQASNARVRGEATDDHLHYLTVINSIIQDLEKQS